MSVAGTYNVTIKSPMGDRDATLTLNEDGSGAMGGADGNQEISGAIIDGNTATWSTNMERPMPMQLDFTATVDGDSISGEVKAGAFGTFPVSGTRT